MNLSACESVLGFVAAHSPELSNLEAERAENLSRHPELAEHLEQLAIPQDDYWHFGGSVKRIHDKQTGEAIGWTLSFRARHALPFVLRPPFPKRPRPPLDTLPLANAKEN